jgi:hypothetical protein
MKTTEYYIYDLDDSPLFIYTEKSDFISQTKEYFTGMSTRVEPEGVVLFHGDLLLPAKGCLRKVDKDSFMNEAIQYLDNMEEYGTYLRGKLNFLHKQNASKTEKKDNTGFKVINSKKRKNEYSKSNYNRKALSRKNA